MPRKRNDRSAASSDPSAPSLPTQVRQRRKSLHLTQEALADLAGCSSRFVREVEGGKTTVRLDKLLAVLHVLGLELSAAPRRIA